MISKAKVLIFGLSCMAFTESISMDLSPEEQANFIERGYCSEAKMIPDFDPEKYKGHWYVSQTVYTPYQYGTACITNIISSDDRELTVQTVSADEDGTLYRNSAVVTQTDESTEWMVSAALVPDAPYNVIKTDYKTFGCIYSCIHMLGIKAEVFWIETRMPNPSFEMEKQCFDSFNNYSINVNKFIKVDQNATICSEVRKNLGFNETFDYSNEDISQIKDTPVYEGAEDSDFLQKDLINELQKSGTAFDKLFSNEDGEKLLDNLIQDSSRKSDEESFSLFNVEGGKIPIQSQMGRQGSGNYGIIPNSGWRLNSEPLPLFFLLFLVFMNIVNSHYILFGHPPLFKLLFPKYM